MRQISSSKQAAYLVRTAHGMAPVGTGAAPIAPPLRWSVAPPGCRATGARARAHAIRSPAGDAPRPWEARTTVRAGRAASRRLGDRRLHVRVSDSDVERARALASALDITASALVRLLLQLPMEDVAAHRHVMLDLACANRLYRELNQWACQQN